MKTTTREYYTYVYQLPNSRIDNICNRIEEFMCKVGYQEADIKAHLKSVYNSTISNVYDKCVVDISDLIGKDTNGYYLDITTDTNDDSYYHYFCSYSI